MLELDMLLAPFAESVYPNLPEPQKIAFRNLLTLDDPQLFGWLIGHEKPQGDEIEKYQDIIELIQQHATTNN